MDLIDTEGHPTVEEAGGCMKTKLISKNRPFPKLQTIIVSVGCLKRQYVVSFIQKHGRRPAITNASRIKNKILKRIITQQSEHINL